ncbi:Hypothetical protein BHY_1040 (plasmid) [Borrelia nietonii YOR]|uniref:Uncharacterized protein n=2 Tax=Borrelia TaxID=138 RepID=W5SFU0_9SPIR|nr:hypothetical protein [Borrelia nietonii]AHH03991.1 Hypothetical protein BHY_1040 [Borrelia nietonii YOR]AHH14559.1 Hypothetical protein BHW_0023500 [Borrelia hermsii MTW]UPA09829.1 hypothetical protein bhYOR_001136 [Borrelia nietonii YOR]
MKKVHFIYIILFGLCVVACEQSSGLKPQEGSNNDGYSSDGVTSLFDDDRLEIFASRPSRSAPRRIDVLGSQRRGNLVYDIADIVSMLDHHKRFIDPKKYYSKFTSGMTREPVTYPLDKMSLVVNDLVTHRNILAALHYKIEPPYILMKVLSMLNLDDPASRDLRAANKFISVLDQISDLATKVVHEYLHESRLNPFVYDVATLSVIAWNLETFLNEWKVAGELAINMLYDLRRKMDRHSLSPQFTDKESVLNILERSADREQWGSIASNFRVMEYHASLIADLVEDKYFVD